MRSLSRNSKWTSKTYSQESSDSNWKLATPTVEAKHKKIILEDESTPTSLVTRQNIDVQTGDKLLVKLSDNSYQEVVAEAVSQGGSLGTATFQTAMPDEPFYAAVGSYNTSYNATGPNQFSPDGLTMWSGTAHSISTGLVEFKMTTPFDLNTLYFTGNVLGTKSGHFFSQDGKVLVMKDIASYTVRTYRLAIPWDISSVIESTTQYWGTSIFAQDFTTGAFSADGKRAMFYKSSTGYLYTLRLHVPFDLSSASAATDITDTSIMQVTNYEYHYMPPDGKHLYIYYDDIAATNAYLKRYTFNEPFNISAGVYTTTLISDNSTSGANIFPWSAGNTNNDGKSRVVWSPDMRNLGFIPWYGTNPMYVPATTKWNDSTIIDISTAGLTEVPTEVIQINDLTLSIASGVSSDNTKIRSEPLWLEYSSATTSSAVVGHISPGKVQIGDTLLFNGTDSVTVTGVTETASGLPYIGLGEPDGNKYLNVASVQGNPDYSSWYDGGPKMTFSPDGTRLLVLYNNIGSSVDKENGLKCYNLSTPWDISTLVEDARPIISSKTLGWPTGVRGTTPETNGDPAGWLGIQFSPDGTKLFTFGVYYYYIHVSEAILSTPWDPYTITSASSNTSNVYLNFGSTSANRYKSMYIDPISGGYEVVVTQFSASAVTTNTANSTRFFLASPWSPVAGWPAAGSMSLSASNYISFYATRGDAGNGDGTLNNYRGMIQRFNSDRSVIVYCGSGGTNSGFGTNNFRCKKDLTGVESMLTSADSVDSVIMDNRPDAIITDAYISPDGTRFYAFSPSGSIYEYQVRVETLNKYEITFAPQAQAPTSIHIPGTGNSVSLSPEIASVNSDSVNITWSSDPIELDSRALQIQVDGAGPSTEISTIRLDLFTEL